MLVLQAHLRPGPWVCRSLSEAGHRVVAASERRLPGVRLSGAAAAGCAMPAPGTDARAFVAAVRRAVREHRVDVILPLTESALALLAESGDPGLAARVAGPTPEQYRLLADKRSLERLAAIAGVPTVEGVVVDRPGEPAPEGPVVVKPTSSVANGSGRAVYLRPELARDAAERDRAVARILAAGRSALVQPFIQGRRFHVHAWRGREGAGGLVCVVDRSWPAATGMTASSRVVRGRPDLLALVIAVLAQAGYRGVASADLIEPRGGEPALHDVNPRLPFSVAEAIAAGLDTPRLAVQIALGQEPETPPEPPRAGHRYHWASGELRWIAQRRSPRAALELGRSLVGGGGVVDPFARASLVPGLLDIAGTLANRMRRP